MAEPRIGAKMMMDSSHFVRGLAQAGAKAKQFGSQMRSVIAPVAAMFGVGGAGGLAFAIKTTSERMSEMLDLARKSGADFVHFQKISQAFRESGSSTEQLASAMARIEKSTGEAVIGTKLYTDAFQRLNIALGQFNRADANEKILQLADAWRNSAKSGEDVVAMNAIMGRSFADLRQTMDLGREGIEETGKSIVAMSEESTEHIKKVEAQWHKMRQNFTTGLSKEVVDYVTKLKEGLDAMKRHEKETQDVVRTLAQNAIQLGGMNMFGVVGALAGPGFKSINPQETVDRMVANEKSAARSDVLRQLERQKEALTGRFVASLGLGPGQDRSSGDPVLRQAIQTLTNEIRAMREPVDESF